jgi:hypothetical protein
MKKIIVNIIISLLFISCTNTNDMITIIDCNGIEGKPEYMHFSTENEGYMFNYKGNLYSETTTFVFKTTDGGKNWKQIYSGNGYLFSGSSILCSNAVFGYIKNAEDIAKNNLFKLDFATQEFKLLDFNIEATGNIWWQNDSVCLNFYNQPQHYILATDTNFLSFSVKHFGYTTQKNSVISDSANTYFITYKNQFVIETSGKCREITIQNLSGITKIAENKVLIATKEQENAINLYQFDAINDKLEKLQTFENYTIISHLQSNEKVIVGFVGNIKGLFVEYDLIYSTDRGQSWQIQKLKEKKLVTPNCLVYNILYIYSGRKLQKIIF